VSGYMKPGMIGNSTPKLDSITLPPKTATPVNAQVEGVKKIQGIEYGDPIALSTAQVLATVKFAKQQKSQWFSKREKTQWYNYEDIRKLPGARRAMNTFSPQWR